MRKTGTGIDERMLVLWRDVYTLIGMLMIPKTLMYEWMVTMGYKDYKSSK